MPEDELAVPGVGWVRRMERRSSSLAGDDKKAMARALTAAISYQLAVDASALTGSGEIDQGVRRVASRAMDELLDVLSWSNVKQGVTRFDIDPDEFRKTKTTTYVKLETLTEAAS
jgi:hypothetical protein